MAIRVLLRLRVAVAEQGRYRNLGILQAGVSKVGRQPVCRPDRHLAGRVSLSPIQRLSAAYKLCKLSAMTNPLRWQQRFSNYRKALGKLKEALEGDTETLSDLEKEGVIQRFEYTHELAWTTLKDYLEYQGLGDRITGSRDATREAFAAGSGFSQNPRVTIAGCRRSPIMELACLPRTGSRP